MPVHVIGNACIDMTFDVERLPTSGETINADGLFQGLGGKGLNQAIAASRSGATVTFWAAVGEDGDGDRIFECLAAENVATDGVSRLPLPTDRSVLMVDRGGENMIVSAVQCTQAYDPLGRSTLADSLAENDIVVLQGNLGSDVTAATMALARSKGGKIIFNASPLGSAAAAWPGLVDVLVVNRQEAGTISGLGSPAAAAAALRRRGAATVIVTLGADGVLVLDHEGQRSLPARPVAAIDTSGAGDVFCGVFAAAFDRSMPPAEAVAVANRAASIAVTRRGTLASCPTAAEIMTCFKAS